MPNLFPAMLASVLLAAALPGQEFRLPDMPNFSQRGPGIANANMCGPTAMADILGFLGKTGAITLTHDLSGQAAVVDFINLLGSDVYMHTDALRGTSETGLTSGLVKFLDDQKVRATLQTEGWYCCERYRLRPYTEYGWIQDQLKAGASVMLSIGWYRVDAEKQLYQRVGGHFVTCAGFNDDSDEVLYIDDPGSRDASRPVLRCVLQPLEGGYALQAEHGAHGQAGGCYAVQGLSVMRGCDVGVIDYGLSIKIRP